MNGVFPSLHFLQRSFVGCKNFEHLLQIMFWQIGHVRVSKKVGYFIFYLFISLSEAGYILLENKFPSYFTTHIMNCIKNCIKTHLPTAYFRVKPFGLFAQPLLG